MLIHLMLDQLAQLGLSGMAQAFPNSKPMGFESIPAACSKNDAQAANGSFFQKLLLHRLAWRSAWRGFPGPPSTCNALTFTGEARRRSIYWLASWLAQNSHL